MFKTQVSVSENEAKRNAYAAQMRLGEHGPWITMRIVESPGVALCLAHSLAKGWLGVAESRFEPMPDVYWEFVESQKPVAQKAESKRRIRSFKHKLSPQDFDAHVIEYLADKLENAPDPQCRTCDHYLYDPSESRIPFCTLHKQDTHREHWCNSHTESYPTLEGGMTLEDALQARYERQIEKGVA